MFAAGDSLTLTISAEPGAKIYYTLDSSDPDPSHIGGYAYKVDPEFASRVDGHVTTYAYSGPITINDTTVVRAAAFKDGQLSSMVETQTYFFGLEHTMQVVSLVMDPMDMWSYEKGLYVKGLSHMFAETRHKDDDAPQSALFLLPLPDGMVCDENPVRDAR